jgi:hypothetical protein
MKKSPIFDTDLAKTVDPDAWLADHPDATSWWSYDGDIVMLWYVDKASGQMVLVNQYTMPSQEQE